jgi:hypothetical protein
VDLNKARYIFDQVDYYLIRLLLIALLGISAYKLVELEFRELPDKISPASSVTRLRCDGEANSVDIASASEPVMTGPERRDCREKRRPGRQAQHHPLSSKRNDSLILRKRQ